MPYANPRDKQLNNKKRYAENREAVRERTVLHRLRNPKLHAFWGHRHTANQRGVAFNLTFNEWCEIWGSDFEHRGRGRKDLCMCRYDDEGPYELGNVYIDTNYRNSQGPRRRPEEPPEGLVDEVRNFLGEKATNLI